MTHNIMHDKQNDDKAIRDAITATTQQMMSAWEERIPVLPGEKPLPLSTKRKITLQVILGAVFHCDMTRWSKFVDAVAGSDFLTGRRGRRSQVSLDWALKPENCISILADVYSNDGGARPGELITPAALAEILAVELSKKLGTGLPKRGSGHVTSNPEVGHE